MQLDDATVPVPWLVSGRSARALAAQAGRLHAHQTGGDDDPSDVALSLATTRAALPRRAVVVAAGRDERLDALSALAAGRSHPSVVSGPRRGPGRAAMVFPGQGSQWTGMGLAMRAASPAFDRRLDECAHALSEFVSWDPVAVLNGTGDVGLDEVDVVQPMLWAVMVSLAAAWSERGVEPVAVVGHSQGEIAAATVAGALDLPDAARVVALRSRIIRRELAGRGAMMSLPCSADEARDVVAPWRDDIEIAAVNGPANTVVCGPAELVDPVLAAALGRGVEGRRIQVDYASHSRFVESVRSEILEALAPVRPRSSRIAFHSTVTAGPLDTAGCDADYWYRNLRQTVLFADAVRGVLGSGVDLLVEASPHPLLRNGMQEIADSTDGAGVVGTLRRDDGGADRWTRSLAEAWVHGAQVDWRPSLPSDPAPQVVDLPTYAFQHSRFWINVELPGSRLSDVGQDPVDHPLLGAAVDTGSGGVLLTGRLSRALQPWLCGHAVDGVVVVPGTVLVEAAVRAGDQVGARRVEELTLPAPLVLPETGGVALRVEVGPPGDGGSREVAVLARPGGEESDWTRHAEGRLADDPGPDQEDSLVEWPPPGAEPVDTADAYEDLAALGYEYDGPFRGLQAAWRRGTEVYAEVALPDGADADADAERFAVHPALLDAAMHADVVTTSGSDDTGTVMLPFAWTDVVVHSTGATTLRLRSTPLGGGSSRIEAFDGAGAPVVTIGSILARPSERGPARAAAPPVYRVRWSELTSGSTAADTGAAGHAAGDIAVLDRSARAPEPASGSGPGVGVHPGLAALAAATAAGDPVPELVLYRHHVGDGCFATDPDGLHAVLEVVRAWVTDPAWADSRLVVIVRGGADVPAAGAVCGLVRAAEAEHPGRFVLVDGDGDGDDLVVRAARAGLPEVAVRDGQVVAPLVERIPPRPDRGAENIDGTEGAARNAVLDPDGTVLVTGGLSGLGALTARQLVERHGARRLLLTGRRGADTPGAAGLTDLLEQAGATVRVAACDVSDRAAVDALLASVGPEHPLTAVVHAAGVLDDGLVESMTPERLARVTAPKIDGAWHLHDGTRDADLRSFVVLSSAAGVLGAAGQGNYAAANAAVDALVAHRRGAGLPATSLRWGLWADSTGMTGEMSADDVRRLSRQGFPPMSTDVVLALLDEALTGDEPAPLLLRLDRPALRAQADAGRLPAILTAVAGSGTRRVRARDAGAATFADTLARTPEAGRRRLVLDLVRARAADVLGHASADGIEDRTPFRELGVDSLTSLELRRALNAETGLTLPATVLFDHGTPDLLAAHVHELLAAGPARTVAGPSATGGPQDDPIVVVGTACRFPRGIDTPEAFWELLATGGTATGPFPTDRGWDVDGVYDPRPGVPGRTYTRSGGFLDSPGDFDAGFFGMSPVDADRTDPQQRILLETSWEAFERAGIDPDTLRGSDVGVFAGAMYHDYPHSTATGSIVSGLLSYTYGFEGPAMTVDTACSSSLVSLHLAMRSLRSRECSLALVSGVTVMATPEVFLEFGLQRGLSPDGRCRSFTADADGTGFSEGAVSLVVARLSDARRDGLPVLAVLAGSAVNSDGASNGLTAPSMPAQSRLLTSALRDAGLSASDVDVVEGHGTGTPLGDPIEIGAVVAVYDGDRPDGRPLRLGSVKANLGHTQAAAGLAGVLKTVLALRHGVFPAQADPGEPTGAADWGTGGVVPATEPMPWVAGERPRRAGVSSFGISGTNAHVVVAEPPRTPEAGDADRPDGPVPVLVSGASEAGLRAQCRVLADHLDAHPDLAAADLGATLATRAALRHRAAVVVHTGDGPDGGRVTAQGLRGLAEDGPELPGTVPAGRVADGHRLALLFSGQGSHRPGMGRELHRAFPAFAGAFDAAVAACDAGLDRSLRDVMWDADGAPLARTEFAQPAIFAFEVAAFRLLESWGVVPDQLIGHSVGEIAAAHAAGALDLGDAAALATARGRLMQRLAGCGSMVAVAAPEAEVAAELGPGVEIAAVNGPRAVVVSGGQDAVRRERERWAARGARTSMVAVDVPFHSAALDPVLAELEEIAATLRPAPLTIPMISSVTGAPLDATDLTDPSYWADQARRPVRFADALASLASQPHSRRWMTVELGAVPALTGHAMAVLGGTSVAMATGDRPEPDTTARAAAELFVHGAGIDRAAVLGGAGGRTVSLPTYPFRRRRHWIVEPHWAASPGAAMPAPPGAGGDTTPEPGPPDHDGVPEADWTRVLELDADRRHPAAVDVVRSRVAATLGHGSAREIEPDRPFAEIGFTSILAVDLARRLAVATGSPVEPTTAFDHPTPEAVATMLLAPETAAAPTLARLDLVGRDLAAAEPGSEHAELIRRRLTELLRAAGSPAAPGPDGSGAPPDELSDDELFRALDDLEMGTRADG